MTNLLRAAVLATVALAACQSGVPTFAVTAGQPADITLRRGEVVLVGTEPLRLAFRDVVEDSRCPRDVTCVWEGNGKVRLGLALGSDAEVPADLNTTLQPSRTDIGSYRISLIGLSPDPVSTSSIPPQNYRARLLVERR